MIITKDQIITYINECTTVVSGSVAPSFIGSKPFPIQIDKSPLDKLPKEPTYFNKIKNVKQ